MQRRGMAAALLCLLPVLAAGTLYMRRSRAMEQRVESERAFHLIRSGPPVTAAVLRWRRKHRQAQRGGAAYRYVLRTGDRSCDRDPAAAFVLPAPRLCDGAPGDTATFYQAGPGRRPSPHVLVDLGPAPPGITRIDVTLAARNVDPAGSAAPLCDIAFSDDGAAFANAVEMTAGQSPGPAWKGAYSRTFGLVSTHRYWEIIPFLECRASPGDYIRISDIRLYDGFGNAIKARSGEPSVMRKKSTTQPIPSAGRIKQMQDVPA